MAAEFRLNQPASSDPHVAVVLRGMATLARAVVAEIPAATRAENPHGGFYLPGGLTAAVTTCKGTVATAEYRESRAHCLSASQTDSQDRECL
jgi:hypothetical protein